MTFINDLRRMFGQRHKPEDIDKAAVHQDIETVAVTAAHRQLLAEHIADHADIGPRNQVGDHIAGRTFTTLEHAMLAAHGHEQEPIDIDVLYLGSTQTDQLISVVARGATRSGEDIIAFAGTDNSSAYSIVLPKAAGVRQVRDTQTHI